MGGHESKESHSFDRNSLFRRKTKVISPSPMEREGYDEYPISTTRDLTVAFQQRSNAFPRPVELSGYLIQPEDRGEDYRLTHLVLPLYMIGVPAGAPVLRNFTSQGFPSVHLAYSHDIDRLGIRLVKFIEVERDFDEATETTTGSPNENNNNNSSEDKFRATTSIFFSTDELSLDRPLAAYTTRKVRQELLLSDDVNSITNDQLSRALLSSRSQFIEETSDNKNGIRVNHIRTLNQPIQMDLIGTKRSIHPAPGYTLSTLNKNKFWDGEAFGDIHTHFLYPPQVWENDHIYSALDRHPDLGRVKVTTLLTPPDIAYLKAVPRENNQLSLEHRGREMDAIMGIAGIVAFDESGRDIIGSSFLDVAGIVDDEQRQTDFQDISMQAVMEMQRIDPRKQDPEVFIDYFLMMAQLSTFELPDDVGD